MTSSPILCVTPRRTVGRKRRVRACIPCPHEHIRRVHNGRVVTEVFQHRLDVEPLHGIVSSTVGKIRQRRFAGLRINKYVRLVGALVHSRTPELSQPDVLTGVVCVAPIVDVLLTILIISDGCLCAGVTRRLVSVEIIPILTAGHPSLKRRAVIRLVSGRAPVGEG